jgi:ethanolamine utilization protein EutQ (cupin superfamily)
VDRAAATVDAVRQAQEETIMGDSPVRKMALDPANLTQFEPTRVDHITAGSGLHDLGCVFMTFDRDGRTEPWTLRYEEVIFVVSGELTLTVIEDGAESIVTGHESDVLTLHKGATVRYGGTKGTRLFVSLYPVNWRQLADTP